MHQTNELKVQKLLILAFIQQNNKKTEVFCGLTDLPLLQGSLNPKHIGCFILSLNEQQYFKLLDSSFIGLALSLDFVQVVTKLWVPQSKGTELVF